MTFKELIVNLINLSYEYGHIMGEYEYVKNHSETRDIEFENSMDAMIAKIENFNTEHLKIVSNKIDELEKNANNNG
jgi:hypothetical protein